MGMVGNAYFLEKIVIIDFKELKIGIAENIPIPRRAVQS